MRNAPQGGALRQSWRTEQSVLNAPQTNDKARVTRAEFVRRILDLGRRHGDIPTYGSPDWEALDLVDPRRFAAVVRAAECWHREGQPDVLAERLADGLAVADFLARYRIRALSWDLSEAEDWSAIARWTPLRELQRLRAYGTEDA